MPQFVPFPLPISPHLLTYLVCFIALGGVVLALINARRLGWEIVTFLCVTLPLGAAGMILWLTHRTPTSFGGMWYATGVLLCAFCGMGLFFGLIEFGLLRLLGLSRMGAIARVTYYEALLQPFSLLVLAIGLAAIGIMARVMFFTYNEDFKMYRDIASSFVFLFSLPIMVFASTKVIDEEIENRTMLTLMSKPVSRTQVVLGKYLGVLVLVLACVATLGIMAGTCGYLRYFDEMAIDFRLASSEEARALLFYENWKAFFALFPSLVLTLCQVAALAAISVAVSTRFGLAVNITAVVLIYITASMARFIGNAAELPAVLRPVVGFITYLLPGLSLLDINQRLIFSSYMLGEGDWAPGLPTYGLIWQYVGLAAVYTLFYIAAVLSFGVALFRTRELT